MAALWELLLVNPAGETIIPQWGGATYKQRLYGRDELTMNVSGSTFETGLIVARQTDIIPTRDGDPQGRARVMTRPGSAASGKYAVTVGCVDYRGVLYGRILHHDLAYSGVDQTAIAFDLIDYTQDDVRNELSDGDLGLVAGTLTAGQPRDRQYAAGATIGKLIDDLTDNVNGFDWWVDETLAVHMQSPRRYRDKTAVVLQLGATLSGLSDTPADRFLNVARQTGKALIPETATALPDARGRWEENQADPDLVVQSSVLERAQRRLADGQNAPTSYVAKIAKGEWGKGVPVLKPGDVTTLRADVPGLFVDGTVRVLEVAYALPTEDVTLALLEET